MNMKPQKPIPQPKGQPQLDLKNATTMRCEKCDNPIFIQGYVIVWPIKNYPFWIRIFQFFKSINLNYQIYFLHL